MKKQTEKITLAALAMKNWWKIIIIFIVAGVAFSGIKIKTQKVEFEKSQMRLKK